MNGDRAAAREMTESDVAAWMVARLARMLGAEAADIDVDENLGSYGLDSVEAVTLTAELSDWLGARVSPADLWDHNTLKRLAHHAWTLKR